MPGITTVEMSPDRAITSIATGLSAVLLDTDRGIANEPYLITSWTKFVEEFGYYLSNKYSNYSVKGAFDNGLKNLWGIRIVGDDAKCAKGGDGNKVNISKAVWDNGEAGNAQLLVQSDIEGTTGSLYTITVDTDAADDITTAAISGYDVTLTLAKDSVWKKTSAVCETVLNGYAHLITSGVAVPAVNDSICFYAGPGSTGDNYSITCVDSGAGGLAVSYSGDGLSVEIDLGGATPTANAIIVDLDIEDGDVSAFVTGTGAGTWDTTFAATSLAGGSTSISTYFTAYAQGDGEGTVINKTKTYLVGTGETTVDTKVFSDTSTLTPMTAITDKVIPGDYLVIYNGANQGAYAISDVKSQTQFTVDADANFTAQANCIWSVFGSDARYGHISGEVLSSGARGSFFTVELTQERSGTTLKGVVKVIDADGTQRTLETLTGLSPVPGDANFIDTRFASESRWVNLTAEPNKELSTGSNGVSSGSTFTSAGSTFETDGVAAGSLLICENEDDIGVWEVLSVASETELEITGTFSGDTVISYTIMGEDADGTELLSLVGTSAYTIYFGGGVSDDAHKDDYEGDEAEKTGVYAIRKIPVQLLPNKFWVPESPVVVDDNGLDATLDLDSSMGDFAAVEEYLLYLTSSERGLTPTTLLLDVASAGIDNNFYAEYYPWGKVDDPLTGTSTWIPLTGHMVGLYDRVDSGAEGMHKAPANEKLIGISELEYDVTDAEGNSINDVNVNVIRKINGFRPYGARLLTSDEANQWIHKRLVTIRTVLSVVRNLQTWVPFSVNSPTLYNRIKSMINSYCSKYDRRRISNGCFENKANPNEKPWYIICGLENNDLASSTVNVELGISIVDTAEEVIFSFGLWDGGFSIEEL